ncbi:MAG: hypothetical protein LBS92_05085 [Candidatus Methanoplasma sp.]|jgi:hypothetical protein|nr:hypothetical protein [Candidatus Methanoplasma sp.]
METKRRSTAASAAGILFLALLIAALAVTVVMNASILESLVATAIVLVVAAAAAIGIVLLAVAVLALPYYAAKGEQYQTDADYDLDDVKPVKEKDSGRGGGE